MAIVTGSIPGWEKVKFFYNHDLNESDTVLSSTNSTNVENIYTRDESTYWIVSAAQTTAEILLVPTGINTITADYLAIGWHTLGTTGTTLKFQYNNGVSWVDLFDDITPEDDITIIEEFSSINTSDGIKLTLTFDLGETPQIGMAHWGEKTELDYAASGFDPNARTIKNIRQINGNGYLNNISTRYTERSCKIQINDVDTDIYDNILDWHETVKRNLFFVGWETEKHSENKYIMRSKNGMLSAPYSKNGLRNISIDLVGVV